MAKTAAVCSYCFRLEMTRYIHCAGNTVVPEAKGNNKQQEGDRQAEIRRAGGGI